MDPKHQSQSKAGNDKACTCICWLYWQTLNPGKPNWEVKYSIGSFRESIWINLIWIKQKVNKLMHLQWQGRSRQEVIPWHLYPYNPEWISILVFIQSSYVQQKPFPKTRCTNRIIMSRTSTTILSALISTGKTSSRGLLLDTTFIDRN